VQADLLGINRTSLYYKVRPPSETDLTIKAAIDRVYTAHPEFGYRRVTVWLNKHEGFTINRKAILRHMREMGIQAVYPRQSTSKPNPSNKVYPHLLSGLKITRPDHVWGIDITYIPIRRSWLYLVAILDWYSRYVVAFALDDTLEMGFVLEACKAALKDASPEIMNSDQGSHFTSPKYTELFLEAGSRISMAHKGRAFDNIFVERLWRTVKYENVYPRSYDTPRDARAGIGKYLHYYNCERPHQSLGYRTPAEIYRALQ
jgi:putative transposase